MSSFAVRPRSSFAAALFGILDSAAYGFFVGTLLFDVVYWRTGVVLWDHAAAWLVSLGLVMAIVPRIINLVQVWITQLHISRGFDRLDFLINLIAILILIFNALVHTRDAYGSMPDAIVLSLIGVLLLSYSQATRAVRATREIERHV